MPAPWLQSALDQMENMPAAESLAHLFQIVENEMFHGGGQTNPGGVFREVHANLGQVTSAIQSNSGGQSQPSSSPSPKVGDGLGAKPGSSEPNAAAGGASASARPSASSPANRPGTPASTDAERGGT